MTKPHRLPEGFALVLVFWIGVLVMAGFFLFAETVEGNYTPQEPKQMREWHGHYK